MPNLNLVQENAKQTDKTWPLLNYYLPQQVISNLNAKAQAAKSPELHNINNNKRIITSTAQSSKSLINLRKTSTTKLSSITSSTYNINKSRSQASQVKETVQILQATDSQEKLEITNQSLDIEDINYNRQVQLQITISLGRQIKNKLLLINIPNNLFFTLNIKYNGKISYQLAGIETQHSEQLTQIVGEYINNQLSQQKFTRNFTLTIPIEIVN